MNDPANGSFDARVNVDAVRRVDLTTARYGPEFANAAAGVLAFQPTPATTAGGSERPIFFPPSASSAERIWATGFHA